MAFFQEGECVRANVLAPAHYSCSPCPFRCVCVCLSVCARSVVPDSLRPLWTVACQAPQAPLSVGFSRQEYWSGLPFPPPGDLPDPGIEPVSLSSPTLTGGSFTTSANWEDHLYVLFSHLRSSKWRWNSLWQKLEGRGLHTLHASGGSCEHCFTKTHSANSRRPFEVSRWARAGELSFAVCQLLGLSGEFQTPAPAITKTSIAVQKHHLDSWPVTRLPADSSRKPPLGSGATTL